MSDCHQNDFYPKYLTAELLKWTQTKSAPANKSGRKKVGVQCITHLLLRVSTASHLLLLTTFFVTTIFQDADTGSEHSHVPESIPGPERPGRRTSVKKPSPATTPTGPPPDQMRKANSQVSISHMSTCSSIKPDIDIPELTYGPNPRLPSASIAIDIQYNPDRGRYFITTQDLSPGRHGHREKVVKYYLTLNISCR